MRQTGGEGGAGGRQEAGSEAGGRTKARGRWIRQDQGVASSGLMHASIPIIPPPPFQLDFFTWSHPDFLSIFAAGNNAGNGSASSGKATVGPFDGFGLLPGGTRFGYCGL